MDELFKLGGSSGGARPKILTKINGEDWIIKFPSSQDPKNIGEQEYKYLLVAKDSGIKMSETRLFESKNCSGYFGIKRFDRENDKKVHMVSISGLLETSHRLPNLDYNILMKLTLELTKNYQDIEQLYRLMCFNVFAHNRDDHSKNFSFLYDENKKEWHLSPAALNINFFVASNPMIEHRYCKSSVGKLSSVIYFAHAGSSGFWRLIILPLYFRYVALHPTELHLPLFLIIVQTELISVPFGYV